MATEGWKYVCPIPEMPKNAHRVDDSRPPGMYLLSLWKNNELGFGLKRFWYVKKENLDYELAADGRGKVKESFRESIEMDLGTSIRLVRAMLKIMKSNGINIEEEVLNLQDV